MFLEDDDVNAGAREQETEHEPARPTSNDAATGGECSDCYYLVGRTHLDKLVLPTAVDHRHSEMRAPSSLPPLSGS
jgi:hypothetical protein